MYISCPAGVLVDVSREQTYLGVPIEQLELIRRHKCIVRLRLPGIVIIIVIRAPATDGGGWCREC